jgi:hypothetical protein
VLDGSRGRCTAGRWDRWVLKRVGTGLGVVFGSLVRDDGGRCGWKSIKVVMWVIGTYVSLESTELVSLEQVHCLSMCVPIFQSQ